MNNVSPKMVIYFQLISLLVSVLESINTQRPAAIENVKVFVHGFEHFT